MLSNFTKVLTRTAAQIEKTVQNTVQEVTGPKAIADYDLGEQIGSGGPGMLWKLYRATPKSKAQQTVTAEVCVWYLDKREIAEARARRGTSKAAEDQLLDIFRADAKLMQKLRHPGVVRVVEALDENKSAMAMVTEPIFSSVANALGNIENLSMIPRELENLELGQLEVKHGLMQLAETLSFIHRNAKLIHRGVSPESIFITTNGGWKFGGFGYATVVDDHEQSDEPPFLYPDFDVDGPVMPLQPPLDYSAPELAQGRTLSSGSGGGPESRTSVDVFSLGLLAFHLIGRKPLLRCHNNVRVYQSRVKNLRNEPMQGIPMDLETDLRRMLSFEPSGRPTASEFSASPYFTEDLRLRALRFLDQMIGRDVTQKTEFLSSLQNIWSGFDSRVLRFKVLPPLLEELKNGATQRLALPWVLEIAEVQDAKDFEVRTQPALLPAMPHAAGDVLLLFLKHLPTLSTKSSREVMNEHLLPMVVRAFEDPNPRVQEETLRRSVPLFNKLDFDLVKQLILPRVHMLALRTSVAAVRVHALVCLGDLVPTLDKSAVMDILQTMARCAAVDHSPPTLMCVLGVADVIQKQYGVEFAAEFVLPLITPLLVVEQLSGPQFARFLKLVMDILNHIQDKRGVSLSEADKVSLDLQEMGLGPLAPEAAPATSDKPSWDSESWGESSKPSTKADPFSSLPSLSSSIPPSSPSASLSPPLASHTPTALSDPFSLPSSSPALSLSSSNPSPFQSYPTSSISLSSMDPFAPSTSSLGYSSSLGTALGSGMGTGLGSGMGPGLGLTASTGALVPTPPPPQDDDPFADWPPKTPSALPPAAQHLQNPIKAPLSGGFPNTQLSSMGGTFNTSNFGGGLNNFPALQPSSGQGQAPPDLGDFFSAPSNTGGGALGGGNGTGFPATSNGFQGVGQMGSGGFRLAPPPNSAGQNFGSAPMGGMNYGQGLQNLSHPNQPQYHPPNPTSQGSILDLL